MLVKPKHLILRYDVTTSFNSLLAMLVSGRLMFENIYDLSEYIHVPRNMSRRLFTSLTQKISELHETDEIILLEVEVAMFFISLVLTRVFFLNKNIDEIRHILPMLGTENTKKIKHLIRNFLRFSEKMLNYITYQFEERELFKQALLQLGDWSLNKKIKSKSV